MALPRLRSLIGGSWCDGREVVLDENPADPSAPVAEVELAGPEEKVAREFFTEWKTVYLNPPGGATA